MLGPPLEPVRLSRQRTSAWVPNKRRECDTLFLSATVCWWKNESEKIAVTPRRVMACTVCFNTIRKHAGQQRLLALAVKAYAQDDDDDYGDCQRRFCSASEGVSHVEQE